MIYLILAPLFFGITLIFIKLFTTKVSPLIGNMLFPVAAFVIQFIIFIFFKMRGDNLIVTSKGLWLVVIGGIPLGLYSIFLFQAFSKVGIAKASPVVYIGAIVIATLFGVLFLKEPINVTNIVGIIVACIGLALVFVK